MPPSLDQDNTPGANPQLNKPTSKAVSAGVQISTKSSRKNGTAKDNGVGGVLAALTKNSSKMSTAKTPNPSTQLQSPDMKPAASIPNGNPITSPLLDALSSAALVPSTSHNTNEWAKNVPAFSSGSPSNLINLGESPPTLPSSYEDRTSSFGWRPREQRIGSNPSASPPGRRRPMSYHLEGIHVHNTEDHHSLPSPYAPRRSSMYSQYSRYGQQPPLPHQNQAHFYGAPDPSLLLSPQMPGLIPGEGGYYCGFDSFHSSSQDSFKTADNLIIAGYEGGFDIFMILKRTSNRIARIDGLRGGVYNAKILPRTSRGGDDPLVAVVVHGPVWASSDASGDHTIPSKEAIPTTQAEGLRGSSRIPASSLHENETSIDHYQTTVEVYSIGSKRHVTTLLSLPKTPFAIPTTSPSFKAPPPSGSLTIRADRATIVIASGITGETWIFHYEDINTPRPKFGCIGKVWTTVQQGLAADSTSGHGFVDGDWLPADPSFSQQPVKGPILSLNGRWLAFCPAAPSSQISLRATVPAIFSSSRAPGLNSQAPPQLPSVNCAVETPGQESIMKQLAQQATQELVKGAAYIGKQGVQAWNNYWNKPSTTQPAHVVPYQTHSSMAQQFPPTHGIPSQAPFISKEPGLVSIIDLDSLKQQVAITGTPPLPLATFKIPHGCSFLSFAPSGLALFTASSKGDVQFVWDLMRLQYAKSSFLKGGPQGAGVQGPHVRQIAHFSRMTIARIVDVVWTSPHGERAAMVTEPGTVHILDLPASAFTWPPPRRRVSFQKTGDDTSSVGLTASGITSTAVNSLWTAARPLVSRKRRSSTGISTISAASVTSQAGHGTQVLAAGISRSVGAATGRMNELRKAGNTKLHLPRSSTTPARACIRLFSGKHSDSILVVGGGIVGFYTVRSRQADRPTDKQKAAKGAKYTEYRLPSLPEIKIAPEITRDLSGDLELEEEELERPHQVLKQSQVQAIRPRGAESSIPQAEIESNAPYQPFHTDRRVGLYVFAIKEPTQSSTSVSALLSPLQARDETVLVRATVPNHPWAFGGTVDSTKLDVGPPQNIEDSFYVPSNHRALPPSAIERVMKITDSHEVVEQIVVTTRIRKSLRSENAGDFDEEGFFEDDCEVLDFASQRV